MFGIFGNSEKDTCPIEEKRRLYFERCFLWLISTFGETEIKERKILKPCFEDFPIKYETDKESFSKTSDIIAIQMEIDAKDIHFDIYSEGMGEMNVGNSAIYLKAAEGSKQSGGLYWGKKEDGKYHVAINEDSLRQPENLIGIIAHEFSHIKLLGEGKLKENNEVLTDLTTVVFGLGIFNANSAFKFTNDNTKWGYSKSGYLSQMEWGYALALFAYLREEESPEWIKFLTRNVRADFLQGERFIRKNKSKVFQVDKQ